MFQGVGQNELQAVLGQRHVVLQIGKCDFGLNHPKLSKVARGVAVFSPECWAKRVHLSKRHGTKLCLQLSTDCQVGFLPKEILTHIQCTVLCAGWVVQIHGRHSEHLTSPFGIAARDDGGVQLVKTAFMEERVHCIEGRGAP